MRENDDISQFNTAQKTLMKLSCKLDNALRCESAAHRFAEGDGDDVRRGVRIVAVDRVPEVARPRDHARWRRVLGC